MGDFLFTVINYTTGEKHYTNSAEEAEQVYQNWVALDQQAEYFVRCSNLPH